MPRPRRASDDDGSGTVVPDEDDEVDPSPAPDELDEDEPPYV